MNSQDNPFKGIIQGQEPGTIIAKNESKQFALIECIEPEAAVHWLALPFESAESTETFKQTQRERFLDLIDFAIESTKANAVDYPALNNGFTVKFHIGSFETIPHAKLHILSVE